MATLKLGITALVVYIIGGISAFSGIAMILLMNGRDFLGMGDGRTLGFLFLCIGVSLSIIGILLMRIFRNRGLA